METSKPPLDDALPISNDRQETGFWLWRGEVPSPQRPPTARTSSRMERVAIVIISAARSARWLGPPSVFALIALVAFVTAHLLPGGQSIPANTSAAALGSAPAPRLARPVSPAPPPPLAEAPMERVQARPAALTQETAGPTQEMAKPKARKTVKWRVRHRSPITVRSSHALFAHRWAPVIVDACRYGCDWAETTAWHGGGY
jgi:hypothetical protein